ncbi:MAG: hypothetical protein WC268_01130 [Patescibacteria group bacterium]
MFFGFAGAFVYCPIFDGPETGLGAHAIFIAGLLAMLGGFKLAGGLDWALGFDKPRKPRKYTVIYPGGYRK